MKKTSATTSLAKKVPSQVPSKASGNKLRQFMTRKLATGLIALSAAIATTSAFGATIA